MTALRVAAPGLLTTVQDLGRVGHQRLGVSVSGALDVVSLRAANALLGNPPAAGALEVLYAGPTLVVEAETARLGFAGADAAIEILPDETARSGTRIATMRSMLLHRGQTIRIGPLSRTAALYIAVEGGFDIEPVLGSVSTYIRGGIGGWNGRALVTGDRLPLRRTHASERDETAIAGLNLAPPPRFRAVLGPQDDYFSKETIEAFFAARYVIGADSDRMGMRLVGPKLRHAKGFDIVSDAIAPGSIQVPGSGQPIVLLADRQTTGGYPKIATVISADLPALGRSRIGATIGFEPITLGDAQALRRRFLDELDRLGEHIVPLGAAGRDITAQLHEANLISGAVDAHDL
jgi:biotin-dependent carboxylase-like uncharacterized protein